MNENLLKPMREDGYFRKKLTFDDYCALLESGNLPARKVELIDGDIIFKKDYLEGVDLAQHFPLMPEYEDGYPRKALTLSDCEVLIGAGLLGEREFELIEGEIVYRMPQNLVHAAVISIILQIFFGLFGAERIFTQATLKIGAMGYTSGPEPDVAVLRLPLKHYYTTDTNPLEDVLIVVEVANTTLRGDTTVKALLYAKSAIPECWVVSLDKRELLVYRDPTPEGYANLQTLTEGMTLSPLSAPDAIVEVATLLP